MARHGETGTRDRDIGELTAEIARLRAFVDQASDAMFVSDLSGRIVDCNHLAAASTGYTRQELLSMRVSDLNLPREGEDSPQDVRRDLRPGRPVTIDRVHVRKDGSTFPVEIRVARLQLPDREVILGLARDMTEWNTTNQSLREAEDRFRLAFTTSPDSISISELETGLYIDVNEGFTILTGYTRDEVIGRSAREIDIWADPTDRTRLVERLRTTGSVRNFEASFRTKGGAVLIGLMSTRVISFNDRLHMLAMTRDISDIHHAKQAIFASEEKYRQVVENSTDAIFIAQDGVLKFANRTTSAMTGHSREKLATMPFVELIHPDDRPLVAERHHRRLSGESVPSLYTFRIINDKGETRWVQLNTVLTEWEARPATLNFLRDITEQKDLESQLQTAQRIETVGTLASGIAHDFNNLLTGILGHASLLRMHRAPDDEEIEHINHIEALVGSAADLTGRLLGFARGGKYHPTPVRTVEFVDRAIEMFARTRKELHITTQHTESVRNVTVDRAQLEQVLMNLFVNAWQAMPDGGDLVVAAHNAEIDDPHAASVGVNPGPYVCISVTDTGSGMDEATRRRVFDPFFTTKEPGRGTGLGLASSYGIVRNHGGFISVESEKGSGSTFRVFLPATSQTVIESVQPDGGESVRGQGLILLVDDERAVLDVTGRMLESLGYRVIATESGAAALERYREHQDEVDVVILDLVMPGMSGAETYEQLTSIRPDVKILLSSGYSVNDEAARLLKNGRTDFLQKPFNRSVLSEKVQAIRAH